MLLGWPRSVEWGDGVCLQLLYTDVVCGCHKSIVTQLVVNSRVINAVNSVCVIYAICIAVI